MELDTHDHHQVLMFPNHQHIFVQIHSKYAVLCAFMHPNICPDLYVGDCEENCFHNLPRIEIKSKMHDQHQLQIFPIYLVYTASYNSNM